ncbi:MAG: cupin domain-containing protein [Alphaproteobacteria bacterium]
MPGTVGLIENAKGLAGSALKDWGPVAQPIGEPVSRTRGLLLDRAPSGIPESGVWECTPGTWRCEVERAEFCHFLAGRCTYTHDDGEVIEIGAGATAWFPAGWRGRCTVALTVRKVYAIV